MPPTKKIHKVFHVSLLEPAAKDALEEQIIPPPPPIEVKKEEKYEVNEILSLRIYQRCLKYLVK